MQRRVKPTASRRGATPAGTRRAVQPKAAQRSVRTTASRGAVKTGTARGGVQKAPGRLSAKPTTDHETIQHWVEERGGWPATVARTAKGGGAGILRIDFPGYSGKGTLKEVPWEEWFKMFDERKLAFLYQEKTASGNLSRFFKVIENPEAKAGKESKASKETKGAKKKR